MWPRKQEIRSYLCCFCGETIKPEPPDICVLTLRTSFQKIAADDFGVQRQNLYCHAACLRGRVAADFRLLSEISESDD